MNPERTRILFFRQGNFSFINENVARYLREQFPAHELVQIDVLQDVIKASRSVVYRTAAAALLTYFRRVIIDRHEFRDLYFRTPCLFHAVRRMIAEKYSALARTALFSIQTQSLYDASIDGLSHFLYTDHTHLANLRYPSERPFQLASSRWIELETATYLRARLNLAMSAFVRDSLIRDYGCDPSRVAVAGAAPNFQPPDSLPDNDGYSNRTILFVGIDWERKGGPVLLEAFRKVLEKLPDARLIIAGCTPAVDLPNVQVLGRLPRPEISRLLLGSSVAALPSWREPQGISAIEALMTGIPVVASNIGALSETVDDGKTGRVVPPGDPGALAAALVELLSNPALCRRCGETARETSRARFSPQAVSLRFGQAIRSALAP